MSAAVQTLTRPRRMPKGVERGVEAEVANKVARTMPSAKPPRKSGVRENAAFGADWDKRACD